MLVFFLLSALLGVTLGWPWAYGVLVALVLTQRVCLALQSKALTSLLKAYAAKARR